jgi:FkbM family methyltransferase
MLTWSRVQHGVVERTRRRLPNRRVRREVQGVRLTLPWSHRLPDYAAQFPGYGQNLVALARAVAAADGGRFTMVDIGANVGDSALQVLRAVDAEVLCVEADPYWLPYLATNTGGDPRVHVTAAMLLPDGAQQPADLAPVRAAGTTKFVPDSNEHDGVLPTVTAAQLRDVARSLPPVRLVKVDTDGYDARLVPGLAWAFSDTQPVVFFEFDPELAAETGDRDAHVVWAALEAGGYDRLVVWDNFGDRLGSWAIREMRDVAQTFRTSAADRGYDYWDVAALHGADPSSRRIERSLCP